MEKVNGEWRCEVATISSPNLDFKNQDTQNQQFSYKKVSKLVFIQIFILTKYANELETQTGDKIRLD